MPFFEKAQKIVIFLRGKITVFLAKKRRKNANFHLTDTPQNPENRKTRDMEAFKTRDTASQISQKIGSETCPYCDSKNIVKRGTRQKKKERVQLFLCRSCRRTFTQFSIKGKRYSLPVIIDAISYYNLGFSFGQVSRVLKEKQNVDIQPTTVANWYEENRNMCAYARMRPFAVKEYSPYNVVETATLAHRQLYRFRFHKAKAKLIIKETYRHFHLKPMAEFLGLVPSECPHQYFQEGLRASEAPLFFSKKEMIVRSKQNYATKMAAFATPAASDNKQRHETLQKFMLFNDSVTIATEVPVYLTREDLAHMQTQLGFEVYRPAADLARRSLGEGGSCPCSEHVPCAETNIQYSRTNFQKIFKNQYSKQLENETRPEGRLATSAMGRPAADLARRSLGEGGSCPCSEHVPCAETNIQYSRTNFQKIFKNQYSKQLENENRPEGRLATSAMGRPAAEVVRGCGTSLCAPSASEPSSEIEGANGIRPKGRIATSALGRREYVRITDEKDLPKLITGHVDFIQIRNGSIHILDYKPNAEKEKPIEQLTLYALALSRLTGLRLFEFKCAWFDEKNYFEFFPLHVVYKHRKGNRKKIRTKEGVYEINERMDKVESMGTIGV